MAFFFDLFLAAELDTCTPLRFLRIQSGTLQIFRAQRNICLLYTSPSPRD